jgi:outer membrane biosynthesis protein TonB
MIFVLADAPPADLAKRQEVAPAKSGGDNADKGAIARVVRSHQKAIQACYERELAKNPDLAGKVTVSFAIEGSGRARVDNIEGLEVIAPCLRAEINRWVFPAPKGGDEVSVRIPFVFKSAG